MNDVYVIPPMTGKEKLRMWSIITIFLAVMTGVALAFIYYYIISSIVLGVYILFGVTMMLLQKYTRVLDKKCKTCHEKKKDFFYAWETNLRWRKEVDGYEKFPDLDPNDSVCTQCAYDHKLFDNY